MNPNRVIVLLGVIAALVAVILLYSSVYTVKMMQQALVLELGAPKKVVSEPGLYTKLPLVQEVRIFPKQLLNLVAPSQEVIAQDKKRIVVDAFLRWRIVDPLRFYQSQTDQERANGTLMQMLNSEVRGVLGSQVFSAMLSSKRAQLMRDIRDNMNQETKNFGIVIVDVRILHADLPLQNSEAIYQRMVQERKREANEFRAQGQEVRQTIQSNAERDRTVLLAEATRDSEIMRGEGDAEKTRILAEAYNQDPDFFAFYRSMQAYKDALPSDNTTMLVSPTGDFFRYYGQAGR